MHDPRAGGRVAGGAVAALLALCAVGAPPATAALPDDLHSFSHESASGTVRSPDGILERGCQRHPYRYRVRPADSDWSLELSLADPRGRRVATGYEWQGADPARGRGSFEFCAQASRPGTFTVRARLTWDDGAYHEKRLEPRTIRLRRR